MSEAELIRKSLDKVKKVNQCEICGSTFKEKGKALKHVKNNHM